LQQILSITSRDKNTWVALVSTGLDEDR